MDISNYVIYIYEDWYKLSKLPKLTRYEINSIDNE